MPTHVYLPSRTPPRWYERVLVHPMDNSVAVLAFLFGFLMLAALVIPAGYSPSHSMMRMPAHIGFVVSVFCSIGGASALLGLHWTGETVSTGWAVERVGWLLVSAGLAGYSVAVGWQFPESTFSWLVPALLAAGALLRFWALVLIERTTRRTLTAVRKESRGDHG